MNARLTLAAALLPLFGLACAEEQPGSATQDATEARYVELVDGNFKIQDVAAHGDRLYFARGARGVLVHDANTLEPVESLWFTRGNEVLTDAQVDVRGEEGDLRIMAEGVQVDGEDLIVWGLRDDTPLDPYGMHPVQPLKLVIQSLTPNHELEWRLSLELERSSNLPDVSVAVTDDALTIAVARDGDATLVGLDVPAEGSDVLTTFASLEGARSLGMYPQGLRPAGESYLVPGGSAGLLGLASDGVLSTLSEDEAMDHVVDATAKDYLAFVADHSHAMHVVSMVTGKVHATVEMPDWVTGIAEHEGRIFVSTWHGVYVADETWSASVREEWDEAALSWDTICKFIPICFPPIPS